MNPTIQGYLRLTRPANLPTAGADILAGVGIVGLIGLSPTQIPWLHVGLLFFSSVFLYAGGVMLNDVYDAELDKIERPERPIPTGIVSKKGAMFVGYLLLKIGSALAFLVSPFSGYVSIALAALIVLYDVFSKNREFIGPLNMGLCRAANLLLGMSVIQANINWWYLAVPLMFIFAITMISRGEVGGNNRKTLLISSLLYALVIFTVTYLNQGQLMEQWHQLIFLSVFALMVYLPLIKAYRENVPANIKKAVKAGVVSIIVLDAAMAVTNTPLWFGLAILALLPISIGLAKLFAVT